MTELTVAAALGGILLLVGRQLMTEHSSQEVNIRARSDVAQALGLLEHSLRKKNICNSVFKDVEVGTNLSNLSYENERGDTVSLIRDNTDYGSFRINTGDIYIADYPAGQNQNLINLHITFRLKSKAGSGVIQKKIPLIVSIDAAKKIRECGAVLSDANKISKEKFCKSLSSSFATWTGEDCVFNAVGCPPGQIVESMDGLGVLKCVDAFTKVDKSNLFDTTPKDCTGKTNFKLVSLNGKITVECTGGGGGSCTPIPSCPAPWTAQMSLTSDNTTHGMSWTYNTSLTEFLHIGSDNDECRLFLRANNSCSGVNEFRICQYSDTAVTGCAGSSYPSGGGP